jgi:hypothetical protein
MSEIDRKLFDKVREWVKFAEEDFHLAGYGLTMKSSCPYRCETEYAK